MVEAFQRLVAPKLRVGMNVTAVLLVGVMLSGCARGPNSSAFEALDAMGAYDIWIQELALYQAAGWVDGSFTQEQALALLRLQDGSLLAGDNLELIATEWHECNIDLARSVRDDISISSYEVGVTHVDQLLVDDGVWLLQVRLEVSLDREASRSSEVASLVTADGIGPSINAVDSSCPLPRPVSSLDLTEKAEALLAGTT